MTRVLLVDADIYCWRAAASVADAQLAKRKLRALLADLQSRLNADQLVLALGDAQNFRRALLPSYKARRVERAKPPALPGLVAELADAYDTRRGPGLEADDVLGVLATAPDAADCGPLGRAPGSGAERIIVSPDKDLRSVPGLLSARQGRIERITAFAADRAHLRQTLIGDAVDGYRGCPGVGAKTADQFLSAPYALTRRGRRWIKRPLWGAGDLWAGMISLFERAGLDEAAALTQARVARILRASDFDAVRAAPQLWRPELIPPFL